MIEVTNVASIAKFSDRKKTKNVENKSMTGWFIEDFLVSELQELRIKERFPMVRTTQFDGLYYIPTLEEAIQYVIGLTSNSTTKIRLYIETKHPTYFANANLEMNQNLVNTLKKYNYVEYTMFQSFESTSLIAIKQILDTANIHPLGYVMLLDPNRTQYDTGKPYEEYLTEEGIEKASKFATGFGPSWLLVTKEWVDMVHKKNMIIHPFTFRPEQYFLDKTNKYSTFKAFITAFIELGVDGFFTEDIIQTREIVRDYEASNIRDIILVLTASAVVTVTGAVSLIIVILWKKKSSAVTSRNNSPLSRTSTKEYGGLQEDQ